MTTNEMIYEALTTNSKKKKARWQVELEMLGYKVIKDGSWYISNPSTGKWIDLPYNETNYLRSLADKDDPFAQRIKSAMTRAISCLISHLSCRIPRGAPGTQAEIRVIPQTCDSHMSCEASVIC